MKQVTWLELILIGMILAASLAATVIARKTVEKARAEDAPEEKTFLAQQDVERHEQTVARRRAELDRVHEKLIDARAAIPPNVPLIAHLEQYVSQAAGDERAAEIAVGQRRKAAAAAFKNAKQIHDWNTRVIALRCAAGSAILLVLTALVIVSLPKVKEALPVHRGLLVGAALLSLPLLVVYELFEEAGIVLAAAILSFVLVIVIARASTPQKARA